jgi:hypothetical protein
MWRIHVGQTRKNIWGGLLQKRWCDVLHEQDCNLITKWWDTTFTISPNIKDVKRRRIGVKTFEQHATHYLQESQVFVQQLKSFYRVFLFSLLHSISRNMNFGLYIGGVWNLIIRILWSNDGVCLSVKFSSRNHVINDSLHQWLKSQKVHPTFVHVSLIFLFMQKHHHSCPNV